MNWKLLTGIEFTLIVGICYVSCVHGLSCLFCNQVANVTDCLTQKALCQDSNEECFLDWHILPDLSAVFNAGCRSKQVCNLISTTFGKRTIGCSQCCNSPPNSEGIPCNGHLCKQVPVAAGNTCGICDRVGDPHDCAVDQTCQPSEACVVKTVFTGGVIKHELGCEQKSVCDVLLKEYQSTHRPAIGKRADHGDLVICIACCNGLGCNKKQCHEVIKKIKHTTDTVKSTSYLDLHLEIDNEGQLKTKLYDKRDDFSFPVVNFPFLSSNIPAASAYGVYISQLIRYSRACIFYPDFLDRGLLLTRKLLNQEFKIE